MSAIFSVAKDPNEVLTCKLEFKPLVAMTMVDITVIGVLILAVNESNVSTQIPSSTTMKLTNQLLVSEWS